MIIAASRGISRIAQLQSFLAEEWDQKAVAGWGRKPSGMRARQIADRRGWRCLLLEDGFLRSVRRDDPPLSLLVDPVGVYYDAGAPSYLEQLVPSPLSADQVERARGIIALWRRKGVSKYNDGPEHAGPLPPAYVLVVDQTFGDASIRFGAAAEDSFARMLAAAVAENPHQAVLVKVHPDVLTRRKRGHFDVKALATTAGVHLLADGCHAAALIRNATAVYTVTSQMGFEALIWGKRVRCFGMPFYAGWGLTEDEQPPPERRACVTIEQLVHAALIAAPRYVDPANGRRWTAEEALDYIAAERRKLLANSSAEPSLPIWHRALAKLGRNLA